MSSLCIFTYNCFKTIIFKAILDVANESMKVKTDCLSGVPISGALKSEACVFEGARLIEKGEYQ